MDWTGEMMAKVALVDRWIGSMPPEAWLQPRDVAWTNKDLLGHLAAWSDLLCDEIQALREERPDRIVALDIHAWNAAQVARRRAWTTAAVISEWSRSTERLQELLATLPVEAARCTWCVAWSTQQVSIEDVVRLWLAHVDQHRSRLAQPFRGGFLRSSQGRDHGAPRAAESNSSHSPDSL